MSTDTEYIKDGGRFKRMVEKHNLLFIGTAQPKRLGQMIVFEDQPVVVVREIPREEALNPPWSGNRANKYFYEVTTD